MKTVCLLLLAFILSFPAAADQISWLTGDSPPLYIARGEDAGQGISDRQIAYLTDHLPGFSHAVLRSNAKRTIFELTHRDGVCSVTLLRDPEREKVIAFSKRPIVIPAFRLVTLASQREAITPFLTAAGEVDLQALAASGALNGAYVQARLYPAPIMRYLNDGRLKPRLEEVPDPSPIFSLLRTGRVDFAFLNGLEARYYAGKTGGEILALPIKGVPHTMPIFPSCSDGTLGRRVIARIDSLLADEGQWAAFLAPLRDWMNEADFATALSSRAP